MSLCSVVGFHRNDNHIGGSELHYGHDLHAAGLFSTLHGINTNPQSLPAVMATIKFTSQFLSDDSHEVKECAANLLCKLERRAASLMCNGGITQCAVKDDAKYLLGMIPKIEGLLKDNSISLSSEAKSCLNFAKSLPLADLAGSKFSCNDRFISSTEDPFSHSSQGAQIDQFIGFLGNVQSNQTKSDPKVQQSKKSNGLSEAMLYA